jgi:hypothetical protein
MLCDLFHENQECWSVQSVTKRPAIDSDLGTVVLSNTQETENVKSHRDGRSRTSVLVHQPARISVLVTVPENDAWRHGRVPRDA